MNVTRVSICKSLKQVCIVNSKKEDEKKQPRNNTIPKINLFRESNTLNSHLFFTHN